MSWQVIEPTTSPALLALLRAGPPCLDSFTVRADGTSFYETFESLLERQHRERVGLQFEREEAQRDG